MSLIQKNNDEPEVYLLPIARKIAYSIGSCTMALLLAELKPYAGADDPFAHNRFTTFVENNLCGQFLYK